MKTVCDTPVNDGGGLFDNEGLCDTLIADCNNLAKYAFTGQYVLFCNSVVQMIQKLANLKKGIRTDMESKDEMIEELKRINNSLVKDGADNGND